MLGPCKQPEEAGVAAVKPVRGGKSEGVPSCVQAGPCLFSCPLCPECRARACPMAGTHSVVVE